MKARLWIKKLGTIPFSVVLALVGIVCVFGITSGRGDVEAVKAAEAIDVELSAFDVVLAIGRLQLPEMALVASDGNGMILEFRVPEFQIEQQAIGTNVCSRFVINGYGHSGEPASPELPSTGTMLGIPTQTDVNLTILDIETTILPEKYVLCPVPTPIVEYGLSELPEYQGVQLVQDAEIYSRNILAPESPVTLVSTGFIRSQRVAQIRLNPLQYNPVSGEVRYTTYVRVRVDFASPSVPQNSAQPTLEFTETEPFEMLFQELLLNYETARQWRAPRAPVNQAVSGVSSVVDPVYRILVDEPGIYQINYADLAVINPNLASVDPRTFHIDNQGQEIALYVQGEDDGSFDPEDTIIFYGEAIDSKYTLTNTYWLTWNEFPGVRMVEVDGAPIAGSSVPTYYLATQHLEENHEYFSAYPTLDGDHWYWNYVYKGVYDPQNYAITLYNVVETVPLSATVRGQFRGYYGAPDPYHSTSVFLNGYSIYSNTWDAGEQHNFEVNVSQSHFFSGSNNITVTSESSNSYDIYFTNWFETDYYAAYRAVNDALVFSGDYAALYQVNGFTTDTLELLDITQPLTPKRIVNSNVEAGSGAYTLTFQQATANLRQYLAQSKVGRKSPALIEAAVPTTLRDGQNGADYIIITHGDFYTEMLTLADYREMQGLRTMVVEVQDIYDEFGYGIFSPQPIRDFLIYAYNNWVTPAPSYVLLVGDANYDFKNNWGTGEPNYLPSYLADVDPWIGETAADGRYVCVSGDDNLPDMHLGRLAVKTNIEAGDIVSKIINYKQSSPVGDWNQQLLFVTDNPDSAGNFYAYSDALVNEYLPAPYSAQKVYYGSTHATPLDAQIAIIDAINTGKLLVNYIGHGSYHTWATERLFGTFSIPSLGNGGRLPFFVPMTCADGYYIHPSSISTDRSALAESLLRTPNAGAIASWSPTGFGVATGHDIINQALYKAIFQDDIVELGAATTLAKFALVGQGHDELIDTYLLFGDPALRLNVLQTDVSIDKAVTPAGPVYPGDAVTYTLSYTNTGPATAHHVVISDSLPLGLASPVVTYTGVPITPRAGSNIIWDVADLAAGEGGVITVVATIEPPFTTVLTNTATIETSAVETDTMNNTSLPVANPVLAPDLVINKTGPVEGEPREIITYTIAYTNSGTVPAHQVVISDVLPSALLTPTFTFSGASLTQRPGTTFVWDVADLPREAGGVITVSGTISPSFLGVITNIASIATSDAEYDLTNNETAPVLTGVDVPDLAIRKSGPASAHPGDIIAYTLTYTNVGDAPAPHVVITDTFPPETTLFDYSGTLTPQVANNTLTWETFDLAPDAGGILTVSVTISPTFAGTLANTAAITTNAVEPNQANNVTPPVLTDVRVPDLAIRKTGPVTTLPGDVITYTLSYTNTGEAPASPVTITDILPPGTTLYDFSGTGVMPSGDTIVWEIASLSPDQHGTLTVSVTISPTFTGVLTNVASIATPIFEPDQADNVTSVQTEVFVPDLVVHKTGPASAHPGDTITYTLVYTNAGDITAPYVTLVDHLPPAMQLYDHTGTVIMPHPDNQLTWEIFDLAPGANGTLTITAVISPTFTGWLTNTATIATPLPELNLTGNESYVETHVIPRKIYLPIVTRSHP